MSFESLQFINPANEIETALTEKVGNLVQEHFQKLYHSTSPRMRKELKRLIVRTMWDSRSRDKYGEFYGVPAPRQTPYDTGMLPPEIAVFARPLVQDFPAEETLSEKVRVVLIHEIGHYLGLSEGILRKRGIY